MPAVPRTEGLSKSRAEFTRRLWTRPAPLQAGGRGGGKGAGSAPRTASPTTLQTGLQFLTKDFLRFWMVDICREWGSRLNTGRRHPTGAGGNWGWDRGGEKARRTRGECAGQAPGWLSRSDGEGTKCRRSFLFCAFMEHARARTARSAGPAPYRTAGSLSRVEGKGAPAPPRSAMEPATWTRDHLYPPVSGRKWGTEETANRSQINKGNRLRRDRCNRLKPL